MRIVINRQPTLGERTGIGHYAAELVRALSIERGLDQIDVYPTGWMWRAQRLVIGGGNPRNGKFHQSTNAKRPVFLGAARRFMSLPAVRGAVRTMQPLKHRHFQSVCWRNGYDLYHEPNILPMPCDCPTIATLHDLSAIAHPEWHPADRVMLHERNLDRALSQCVHFLTGSDCTRGEIIRELGVPPEKVTRVYHGIRQGLTPLPADQVAAGLKKLGMPPSYLLHVGTLEPRKNLEMLVRAYCDLSESVRRRCPLLLVGKWGWNTKALAELLDREGKHKGIRHVGYVAEDDLALLYNGARALVYPTHYEGFGLPPLEMMACGGAVLASTAGAVAEVVGRHGHLIEPNDIEGWREALERVIIDDGWIEMLRRGVQRWAASFTWQATASNTLSVYRSLVGSPIAPRLAA